MFIGLDYRSIWIYKSLTLFFHNLKELPEPQVCPQVGRFEHPLLRKQQNPEEFPGHRAKLGQKATKSLRNLDKVDSKVLTTPVLCSSVHASI